MAFLPLDIQLNALVAALFATINFATFDSALVFVVNDELRVI